MSLKVTHKQGVSVRLNEVELPEAFFIALVKACASGLPFSIESDGRTMTVKGRERSAIWRAH